MGLGKEKGNKNWDCPEGIKGCLERWGLGAKMREKGAG